MAYNYATGFLDYKGSVKIKARNRYEHAFGRTKRTLEDKTQGTFKRRGTLLIFKKGALDDTKARLERGTGDKHEPRGSGRQRLQPSSAADQSESVA